MSGGRRRDNPRLASLPDRWRLPTREEIIDRENRCRLWKEELERWFRIGSAENLPTDPTVFPDLPFFVPPGG
jgi:hypothetical protein